MNPTRHLHADPGGSHLLLNERLPQLNERLKFLYGKDSEAALATIEQEFADLKIPSPSSDKESRWSERDVVLITYADQLRSSAIADTEGDKTDSSPLAALREWLVDQNLHKLLSTVHLLPFCPYSSDDGFSVIDYLEVDPESGDWNDIAALGKDFDLMFDLVLNHISQLSEWYQAYLRGESPYDRFFIEADPSLDYSQVVRPRSLPLLTPASVKGELKHVWTTFSADQVDLNYEEPLVLARMLRILVEYALRGARIIRLDAVAFLWKRLGTNCLHLPETHEVVKLMRDVLEVYAPRTLVLTETNVPHDENVSYFGSSNSEPEVEAEADEAHMVYQFSLPPLLLDGFLSGESAAINEWLSNLAPPPAGCTFFNFTASHDGVGMRPLEGLVPEDRIATLAEAVKARGGRINTRRKPDGSDSPYELCITFFEALAPEAIDQKLHVRRFLASQAIMLSLQGMPAIYFHSLVASPNDTAGADQSGIHRRLNRHKYDRQELDLALSDQQGSQRQVFDSYRELVAKRIGEPAFHPEASQQVIPQSSPSVLCFERISLQSNRKVLVAVNFATNAQPLERPNDYQQGITELITDTKIPDADVFMLLPGQAVWLAS